MTTKEEINIRIMELWDEIFTLEEKRKEELDNKYAEWREVEPLLNEGLDAVIMHIESMEGISVESLLIYKEVKEIKDRYKQEMDEKHAQIDALNNEKSMITDLID
jgi:ferric iron reductase protein FhuF